MDITPAYRHQQHIADYIATWVLPIDSAGCLWFSWNYGQALCLIVLILGTFIYLEHILGLYIWIMVRFWVLGLSKIWTGLYMVWTTLLYMLDCCCHRFRWLLPAVLALPLLQTGHMGFSGCRLGAGACLPPAAAWVERLPAGWVPACLGACCWVCCCWVCCRFWVEQHGVGGYILVSAGTPEHHNLPGCCLGVQISGFLGIALMTIALVPRCRFCLYASCLLDGCCISIYMSLLVYTLRFCCWNNICSYIWVHRQVPGSAAALVLYLEPLILDLCHIYAHIYIYGF